MGKEIIINESVNTLFSSRVTTQQLPYATQRAQSHIWMLYSFGQKLIFINVSVQTGNNWFVFFFRIDLCL